MIVVVFIPYLKHLNFWKRCLAIASIYLFLHVRLLTPTLVNNSSILSLGPMSSKLITYSSLGLVPCQKSPLRIGALIENVSFYFDRVLYKFCYLNDVLFLVLLTCCSKLEIVICSDVELGRYGTGTGSGTWMETGRTSNRIMNSPQETSTRSRRGKHRKLGNPNG